MKRALCLVVVAILSQTTLAAQTITLTNRDPRDRNLVDREWSARLREFEFNFGGGHEIYVGSGNLDFAGNRKTADVLWADESSFTLTYEPSPARVTIAASAGLSSGSQFYDFRSPEFNPNLPFNALLIELVSPPSSNVDIRIRNLALSIAGGPATNLGNVEVTNSRDVFARISDIGTAHAAGFTLTGTIVRRFPPGNNAGDHVINFSGLFDRTQLPDLTLSKTHAGNFVQGQIGATYSVTARNVGTTSTFGPVAVVDNLPPWLLPTAADGPGWSCNVSTRSTRCSRSDPLGPGASYPPITLTVTVASTAPALVTNTATVIGGSDGNSDNNTVLDLTAILRGPDTTITKAAAGSFTQGQAGAGYALTVGNGGAVPTSGIVTVTDNLPAGLSPALASGPGWTCGISGNTATCARSDPLAPGATYPPIALTVNVAADAPLAVTNTATVGGGGDVNAANNRAILATPIARAPDLAIAKSHTGTFTQGQANAAYTVTVANTGPAATSGVVLVDDPMSSPLSPRSAVGLGWACNVFTNLIRCQRSDVLAPGASYPPITMTAGIAPDAPPAVTNTASVSGGGDVNAANNSASDVAAVLPAADLSIAKSHAGTFTQGRPGAYTLTVSNTGGSPTSGSVSVVDPLPIGLVPTAANGTGWTCEIAGQEVGCSRSDLLPNGQSYPGITLAVSVRPNAPASVTNTASVFGGGEINVSNNTATDPTTVDAGPNVTITKSHAGNFTQGQPGTYTLTVSNTGGAATLGTVFVIDNLPASLAATAAAGTGWSCTVGGQTVSCQRGDAVNAGAGYPPIALAVDVAADAPASVTNTALVAGGSDVDSSNNTATDPTTIIAVPDLTVTKTHPGSFQTGQVGATYTVTVANAGSGPTSSPVTVSDTLPAGLTPTAAAGAGWVCNIAAQNVSCSRSDALNGGASYPAITLTVNVDPAAPAIVTNTATVSGGGEVNTANNTASDITTIGPGADLVITKSHAGPFRQGQTGATFSIAVSNPGSAPTSGVVTVTDSLPAGLLPTSATGTGWACNLSGQDVTCTRSDPLPSGQSHPAIALVVTVGTASTGSVTNIATVSNASDVNATNNAATDLVLVLPGADLTVSKTHTGNFRQGQAGAVYTVTVANAGIGPTSGPVTVVDTVPLGLTSTAAAGTGWTCTVGGQGFGCERSDALPAGSSYPPISLTVSVAADAPAVLTNIVQVSGGGDGVGSNNSASDPTTILSGPDLTVTKSHAGNFVQGQRGATFTVSVSNSGGSPSSGDVSVVDAMPTGLSPTAATGPGWSCTVNGQVVTCDRSDPLAPGASYGPIALTVDVAGNAPPSLTNAAQLSGGGEVDPANNTANDVVTIAPGPDLTVTKTHTGSFIQGQTGATFTIVVSNQGGSPTGGTVTVTDDMSGRFQPTAASGPGWTCTIVAAVVLCERNDGLPVAASWPPITIAVNVAPNAPPTVINTATVSGGGDVGSANNSASDSATVLPGPDLTVTKAHAATFRQGGRAADGLVYTLTVTNLGSSPTTGTVTLIDDVPAGLIPASVTGAGWTCTIAIQSVTCTRSDAVAGGASYPPVMLGVDVEADAPASVVNTATIGGGGDVNSANNTASDPTQIQRGQDLTISKSHTGTFSQGQRGAVYTISVSNIGGAPTLGTVTLIDLVPAGLVPTAASGPGWACTVSGASIDCTRSDPLAAGAAYEPVTVVVDVAENAPGAVTNRAAVAGGGDVLSADNVADDATGIAPGPDLTISKSHTVSVAPGQPGVVFTLTAQNVGGSPTQGPVDVVDDLPVGLTVTAFGGGGWLCETADTAISCSRGDALAPGASLPPIVLTADVASTLSIGSGLTNTARVSGGGDIDPDDNTATDTILLSPYTQIFAEGATGFFTSDIGILNPSATRDANVTVRILPETDPPVTRQFTLAPLTRTTISLDAELPTAGQSASTLIESDQPLATTRQMTWGDPPYGSTLESGIGVVSRNWYFGEGATNVFSLFFLLGNPGDTAANVTFTHLLEGGAAPVSYSIVVPPATRRTVFVNDVPGLSAAALSTLISSDVPIVAERAMYANTSNRLWEGGTAGGGAVALSPTWFFAEGSSGFFHTYLLLANPADSPATVTVRYRLPSGDVIARPYDVAPRARRTIDVNVEVPELGSNSFAMSLTSTQPIAAERTMWWSAYPWTDGSNSLGSTATGTAWGIGEAAEGGAHEASTFALVSNASATAGAVRFTVVYDDGTNEQQEYPLAGNARLTVRIADGFPRALGQRFSVLVESLTAGVPITVEYARYQSSTVFLDAGGAAVATRIR